MAKNETTVFIVDDDQAMRNSLRWLLESVGRKVETYESANHFLSDYYPGRSGCLVLDVRMPGMSGLELQEKLVSDQITMPVIIITGHGDVPMSVRAMKAGAVDFVEKPFNDQVLLDCIQRALDQDEKQRGQQSKRADVASKLAQLTPREHEVMKMVVSGKPNKVVADQLNVSAKTVEAHRAKVMEKMQASSLAELVKMALIADVFDDE
ncbi:MAG: response regulator transcription factor [Methylococcales bacterium]|jgi:RNA polymerase sigma factor (sigma-70 family)|nr:response regulator transcription factor [Methylococcales bacterium]MBT7410131.1 response regulator transcription factor [Methylococcales bacterium]